MKYYFKPKVIMPIALVIVSAVWLVLARQLPSSSSVTTFAGPSTFPTLILAIMLICSIAVSVQELRAASQAAATGSEQPDRLAPIDIKRIIGFIVAVIAYVMLLGTVTFIPATIVLLLVLLLLFGLRKPLICIAVPVGFTLAIYAIFEFALHIDLP